MKLRPTIFLSGVSSEFASFRDAVEVEIQKKGCFPLNQPSFGTDYREIEEILRRNLSEADAVIHIVGFRFGFEPKNQPADKPRRSYTQLEYDIARELNIPVYVFLSADATIRDANPGEQPEDEETVKLQLAHRQVLEGSNNIRYSIRDKNELCGLVAGIPLLATADFRVDISRIVEYAPAELIGREDELALLNNAWLKVRHAEPKRPHILTFVALGGEGKTSLVAKWAAELAYENWPGCDSAFAWSFYSQGTREQYAASSDLFLKEAITFFGNEADKGFAESSAAAFEKGQRLARIVSERRALLILDGLEPLQYAPTSPSRGELKDGGIAALLKALAANSDGLCIVTTRYSLPNLKAYWQTTAPEITLSRLSCAAGVHLLKNLGVNGSTKEFETLVEDVKGHALTLNLLGTYLRDAHGGDIRRRDLVKLEEADAEEQGGHAFRVMEAYEGAFADEGEKGQRALTIMRLLGLFDRPVTAQSLAALLEEPPILGLTDSLVRSDDATLNLACNRLQDAKLLTVNRETSGSLISLDGHPLLREYFAQQLRTQQIDVWRAAHRRLYEHLCENTPNKPQPSLDDLQPFYQAVVHACQAGLQQHAYNVCQSRIWRGREMYTVSKLGVFGSDLGAIACFFERPWGQVSRALTPEHQAFFLNSAGYCLRALGRLSEALQPIRAAEKMYLQRENWLQASTVASTLSDLHLTLGRVNEAVRNAEQSVKYADRSGAEFERRSSRVYLADALHQVGRPLQAKQWFHDAEQTQKELQPEYPLLYSLGGFKYCDLMLASSERIAWHCVLDGDSLSGGNDAMEPGALNALRRAAQTLKWAEEFALAPLLDLAVNHLTLGRSALYVSMASQTALLPSTESQNLEMWIEDAVKEFRRAGTTHHLPRGLLTRAWLRFINGTHTGPASAQEDLDEAWEIAERGPMRLFMADIHLYRARLFFREEKYPWDSPRKDLEEAERLINECGYHRRDEELADAKRVILGQSV